MPCACGDSQFLGENRLKSWKGFVCFNCLLILYMIFNYVVPTVADMILIDICVPSNVLHGHFSLKPALMLQNKRC